MFTLVNTCDTRYSLIANLKKHIYKEHRKIRFRKK